jgi:hypothetical protein
MPLARRRFPLISSALFVFCALAAVRSLSMRYSLSWQRVDDEATSVVRTAYGIDIERLGLGFFYEQQMATARDRDAVQAMLHSTTPGVSWRAQAASSDTWPLLRRLGFGFERDVNDRPDAFANAMRVRVPLWLLAALFAIAPVRFILRRRRERVAASLPTDMNVPNQPARAGRIATPAVAIAVVFGVLVGIGATLLLVRRGGTSGGSAAGSGATSSRAPGPLAASPLVGAWRMNLWPITATYDFKDDGSFSLRFSGAPVPPLNGAAAHEAFGTWHVDGKMLVMDNTTSTTPFTVPGEEETATIASTSPDELVLLNVDRKGRNELLHLQRVEPFARGACDNRAVIGVWMTPDGGGFEVKDGGEMFYALRSSSFRNGAWSQAGDRLRLQLDPPAVRGAQQRWNPALSERAEVTYEIVNLTSDGQRLTLRQLEPPLPANMATPVTYQRSTVQLQPQLSQQKQRGVGNSPRY